jgi:hypothetical protein
MTAPFDKGDRVTLKGGIDGVVQQCWLGVGGWRVLVKGPRVPMANPLGLYDFSADNATKSP